MSGFFSRYGEALRRELRKERGRIRRFVVAPVLVLMGLAGFDLVALAPDPRLTPIVLGFLALPAGLLLSGLADLLPIGGWPQARMVVRLASLAPVFAGG